MCTLSTLNRLIRCDMSGYLKLNRYDDIKRLFNVPERNPFKAKPINGLPNCFQLVPDFRIAKKRTKPHEQGVTYRIGLALANIYIVSYYNRTGINLTCTRNRSSIALRIGGDFWKSPWKYFGNQVYFFFLFINGTSTVHMSNAVFLWLFRLPHFIRLPSYQIPLPSQPLGIVFQVAVFVFRFIDLLTLCLTFVCSVAGSSYLLY